MGHRQNLRRNLSETRNNWSSLSRLCLGFHRGSRRRMLVERTGRLEGLNLGLTLDVIPFIFFQTFLQRLHITRRQHLLRTLTPLHLLPSTPLPPFLGKREKNLKTKENKIGDFPRDLTEPETGWMREERGRGLRGRWFVGDWVFSRWWRTKANLGWRLRGRVNEMREAAGLPFRVRWLFILGSAN